MISEVKKKYPSKILLIGEYSVLLGGKAISLPYWEYSAFWNFGKHNYPNLGLLIQYLRSSSRLNSLLNLDQFALDVEKELFLECNIPFGYGLGSSGVLTAAIYDRYSIITTENITELKNILGEIESYFHGSSSGLDPLVSYSSKVVVSGLTELGILDFPIMLKNENFEITLVDSGKPRNTKELVSGFQHLMNDATIKEGFKREMMHNNAIAVDSLVYGNECKFIDSWKKISEYSLVYFRNMIPEPIYQEWKHGLESKQFYLKLCGAGGGGFFLKLEVNPQLR